MAKIIETLKFNKQAPMWMESLESWGSDWPVVYIINKDGIAYVGETTNVAMRTSQHLDSPSKQALVGGDIRIISGEDFNKSVILDLESFLIRYMSADNTMKLINGNAGQHGHDYYQKNLYQKQFTKVWQDIKAFGLAGKEIKEIENTSLFKYSPYKTLTRDQYLTVREIVQQLSDDIETDQESTFIVSGGPGTGKTVLRSYIMKLLSTPVDDDIDSDDEQLIENLQKIHNKLENLKIGIVVSMKNLRTTFEKTFNDIAGLSKKMVYSPSEIANSPTKFDILIVDEAHRLKTARNIGAEIGSFYKNNEKLGLPRETGTQLDWIMMKSRHQIFFYDKGQSIKRADIDEYKFDTIKNRSNCHQKELRTQLRCALGGEAYIKYIRDIFSNHPPAEKINFEKYDFRIFDNVREMTDLIIEKDKEFELCRNLAGYAWPWNTKGKAHPVGEAETDAYVYSGVYDIDIEGHRYIWNTTFDGWVDSANSVNEIGCIHTIQGFDLNYAGVIIGNELKYNPDTQKLYIDKDNYYDVNGKNKTSDEDLLKYILNIYSVMCTRGIRGTYIYACDENLRNYLKQYINQ